MRAHRLIACLCALAAAAHAEEKTAAAARAPHVRFDRINFRSPAREYRDVQRARWKIHVEAGLHDEHAALRDKALARLERVLTQLSAAMPPEAARVLGGVEFFLMLGEKSKDGGYNNGAEYFQRSAPAAFPHIDPRWGGHIAIYSAENFVWLTDLWAAKVIMHELAHAWHLSQWPEQQPDIVAAYENAMSRGLYRDVKDADGKTIPAAYATVNALEYFAELSCAWFARCNYPPRDRTELRATDPEGAALMEKMWRAPAAAEVEKQQQPR